MSSKLKTRDHHMYGDNVLFPDASTLKEAYKNFIQLTLDES